MEKPEFRCDCRKCVVLRKPIDNKNPTNSVDWNTISSDKIYAHIMINYMERGHMRGIACPPPPDLFERPRSDLVKLARYWYDHNIDWVLKGNFPTSSIAEPIPGSHTGEYRIKKSAKISGM